MDLTKDPEVVEGILSGKAILIDGGHSSYTLTLPYEYKGESGITTLTLRRYGILFGLSHKDDSDRTAFPAEISSLIPFKLLSKGKDRYALKVARETVTDSEMKKAMRAVKLSRDGVFTKNKFKPIQATYKIFDLCTPGCINFSANLT